MGLVYCSEELEGISKQSGLPLGKLVALQLTYEASTCCTSIIVPSERDNQAPHHIRTMVILIVSYVFQDWAMDFLKPLTIEVEFQSKGITQYIATTWVGYVGVLTGMRPFGYSISVNFR